MPSHKQHPFFVFLILFFFFSPLAFFFLSFLSSLCFFFCIFSLFLFLLLFLHRLLLHLVFFSFPRHGHSIILLLFLFLFLFFAFPPTPSYFSRVFFFSSLPLSPFPTPHLISPLLLFFPPSSLPQTSRVFFPHSLSAKHFQIKPRETKHPYFFLFSLLFPSSNSSFSQPIQTTR